MTEEAIVITENQLALIDANYFISKKGNVFSKRNGYNKELLPDKSIGYLRVKILGKKILIHRLVAKAFIPNPENKPQVNHINGIKTDNRVENLEWCTNSENTQHSYIILNRKISNRKLSDTNIIEIRQKHNEGISQKYLKEIYSVSHSTISEIINNKRYKNICQEK